jgi:hexosaminidase
MHKIHRALLILCASLESTLVLFLGGTTLAFAHPARDASDSTGLFLVPSPKRVECGQGRFAFSRHVSIDVRERTNEDDLFSAAQLSEEVLRDVGVKPHRTARPRAGSVVVGRIGTDKEILLGLKGIQAGLLDSLGEEGYVVEVRPERITVAARTGAGVFYGVQTLKQLVRANRTGDAIPCVTIVDWPSLRYRGWMQDISRGPIPTMASLKKMIATMAEYKQNCFTLYTENLFRLKSHPDLAPADGLTAEEVKDLSEFARKYHCDMIGNAQSFGHMEHILASPFYAGIRETPSVVSPAVEATYTLLKEMYAEIIPAYSSPLFHINCDEVTGLGTGPARGMVDSLGSGGVYAYHINRINDIVRPYGKRLLMWGDIAASNPQIVSRLPKDLVIISWGYDARESFVDAILPFKETGFDFMVAPGVSCWGQVWPNMSNAMTNISNYVRDGAALGAIGMLNTVWDDDGENLLNYNWHGLIWGAECSWGPAPLLTGRDADAELARHKQVYNLDFDALFFGTPGVTAALFEFDSLRTLPVRDLVTDQGVWRTMQGFFPHDVDSQAVTLNKEVVRRAGDLEARLADLRMRVAWHPEMLDAALFAARRVAFTGRKDLAFVRLAHTMAAPAGSSVDRAGEDLSTLLDSLHLLKEAYVGLWERENRSWWLDRVLAKYDRLGDAFLDFDKVVSISADSVVRDGKRLIRLSTPFADQEIVYTVDGQEPTMQSPRYTGPIPIERSSLIRARVFVNGHGCPVAEQYIMVHKAIGKLLRLNSQYSDYNPAYAAGGRLALVDGLRGSDRFADGRWQGYQGQDLNVVLDLQTPTEISSVTLGCLQDSYSWILLPSQVQFWVSDDGAQFTLAKALPDTVDPRAEGTILHDFTAQFDHLKTRYLKVIAKNRGKLPAWHHAAGGDAFIFADEIIVE